MKQKCQIIELSSELSTDQLAKKFRVHPTTVTRTLKKKDKIIDYSSRVNVNYKTIQANQKGGDLDTMILDYIKDRQNANEPITIKEICEKAVEFAKSLNRDIKSKRGWWRRFKVRCNIIRSKLQRNAGPPSSSIESTSRKTVKRKTDKKPSTQTSKKRKYTFKVKENQPSSSVGNNSQKNPPKSPEANASINENEKVDEPF